MPIFSKNLIGILAIALCAGCSSQTAEDPRGLTTMVAIEGSNTMAPLMQSLSTAFMAKHPNIPVSLTSDDSSTGIAAFIKRTTDLAAASRDLNSAEIKLLGQSGIKIEKVTVAGDALVILVNPANDLSELSIHELRQIFSGAKKNWHDFGGANKPIKAFGRSKESGTNSYFQEHILKGEGFATTVNALGTSDALTAEVAKDPSAIAYEGLANALTATSKVKMLSIKISDSGPSVMPSHASVLKDYPLSRPLILFADKNPKKSVQELSNFAGATKARKS